MIIGIEQLPKTGHLGGPKQLSFDICESGKRYSISIVQCGKRTIEIESNDKVTYKDLKRVYFTLEDLLLLFDGQFYPVNRAYDRSGSISWNNNLIPSRFSADYMLAMFKLDTLREHAVYVPLFFCMLKDYFSKKYKEIPVGTIAIIVGTLLYVFSPLDIAPDFLPGVGLLDDAAMMALCVSSVKNDVDKYKEWKADQDDFPDGFMGIQVW